MCDPKIMCEIPQNNIGDAPMQCSVPASFKPCEETCNCSCEMDNCYQQPPRQKIYKPDIHYDRPTLPMETNTIYKCSYVGNANVQRTLPIRVENTIQPFQGRMDSNTIQKLSFQPHCDVRRPEPIIPPTNTQRFTGPFYDITSQKHDFVPKCYSKREPLRGTDGIMKICAPLEKCTVNKLSYMPYDICSNPPPKPLIQRASFIPPNGPGESCTVQKLSYLPVPLPPKENLPWAKHVRVEPPHCGPMCTTYKLSFIPNCNVQKLSACVPEQAIKIFGSEMPDKNTVYKLSYLNTCGAKPDLILPRPGIQISTGAMEKCTVYKLSYLPQSCSERAKPIKPRGNVCRSNAPIQDITTQKHDFVPKPNCRRPVIIPPTSLATPSCPMEKCTINKLSYLPQTLGVKCTPILPRPGLCRIDAPMSKCTTYKLSYMPVPLPPKEPLPWARQTSCFRSDAPIPKCTIQKLSYGAPGRFMQRKGNCSCFNKNSMPASQYPKAAVCS